jgi:hypothetical protein
LEICAGGVHDQLWQKTPVEEMEEIRWMNFSLVNLRALCGFRVLFEHPRPLALTISPQSAKITKVNRIRK